MALATHLLQGAAYVAVLVMGLAVFSAANALLLVMWGERWSTLATGQVGRCLYTSYALAIAVYLLVGVLPWQLGAPLVAACPVASAAILAV